MTAEEIFETVVVLFVGAVLFSTFFGFDTEFIVAIGPDFILAGFILAISVAVLKEVIN